MSGLPNAGTIFLAEDDDHVVSVLKAALEQENFRVVHTGNVNEVPFKLRNQLFDLIILDFWLGKGRTDEAIRRLRSTSQEVNQETPILVISGALDPTIVKSIVAHISGVLLKPFETDAFVSRVKQLTAQIRKKRSA